MKAGLPVSFPIVTKETKVIKKVYLFAVRLGPLTSTISMRTPLVKKEGREKTIKIQIIGWLFYERDSAYNL